MERMIAWLAASATAIAASVVAPGSAKVSVAQTCPAPTVSDWNPYTASSVDQAACGLTAIPVTSEVNLPSGGQSWVYASQGEVTAVLEPPAGFDPSLATSAQRAEYGIPNTLPSTTGPNPPFFVQPVPALLQSTHELFSYNPTSQTTPNWAGYVDHMTSGYFHYASMNLIQPKEYSSACGTNTTAAFWVGIGGWQNNDLGQAGTSIGASTEDWGISQNEAFDEDTDLFIFGGPHADPISATTGQGFYIQVFYGYISWAGFTGYQYYFQNDYTGATFEDAQGDLTFDGSTTDFIAEDPNGGYPDQDLSNFGNGTSEPDAQFDDVTSAVQAYPVNHYPNYQITMKSSSAGLQATPSALTSNGYNFSVAQNSCQ
jgi:hypothetical protein